ncbi:hypothetical protein ACCY16_19380 [Candidatus Pantoea formicae]|uniref:hypothetical protein n=1 Tax=Candidatus Pantoea formicae TaxID=2608355 RepID=UPI003ED983C1
MKYFWKPLLSYPGKTETRFPRLFTAVAAIGATLLTLIFGALTLENEQLTLSMLIWRLLVMPVAVCSAVISLCFVIFHQICSWRLFMQLAYSGNELAWKYQAAEWMRLAEHASMFPVDNAALKMLKLEGEMPVDGDIPLRISVEDDETSGMSRMQIVVQRLLEQLDLTHIDARIERPELFLYVGNTTESVRDDLTSLLQSAHASLNQASFHYFAEMPDLSLLQQWAAPSFSGFRLLLIVELHDGANRNFCEYACALLFSHNRKIGGNRLPVCCFKGMSSKVSQLGKKIHVLLSAEQIKPSDLRHVWIGDLQGESLHLLVDSLKENKAGIQIRSWQNMQIANTWASGYQWLMMEWSAKAVRNGQRGQLIAAKESKGEQVMVVQMNSDINEYQNNYGASFKQGIKKNGIMFGCTLALSSSLLLITTSIQEGWTKESDDFIHCMVFILPLMMALMFVGLTLDISNKRETGLAAYYDYE